MSEWIKQPQPGMHLARVEATPGEGPGGVWWCAVLHKAEGPCGQFYQFSEDGAEIIKLYGGMLALVDYPFMEYLPLDKGKLAEAPHGS